MGTLNADFDNMVQSHIKYLSSRIPLGNALLHSPESADEALIKIDTECAAMKQAMLSLMPRRNALLPISRLPSEVLGLIFQQLTTVDPPYREVIEPPRGSFFCLRRLHLGWISGATHVCTAWRTVACQQPMLWTTLSDALSIPWRDEFIVRSGKSPLYLEFLSDQYETRLKSTELHRYLSTGRVAGLEYEARYKDAKLGEYLSQPNKLLRHLHIADSEFGPIAARHELPPSLFSGSIPPLDSVLLYRWGFRWSTIASLPHTLTTLHIVGTTHNGSSILAGDSCGPWQGFVDGIQSLTSLESLKLHQCIPDVPTEVNQEDTPRQQIALSRIREFDLYTNLRGVVTCLRLIALPDICTFRIRAKIDSVRPNVSFMDASRSLVDLFVKRMSMYGEYVAPMARLSIQDHGLVRIDAFTRVQDFMCEKYTFSRTRTPALPDLSLAFDAGTGSNSILRSLVFFNRILRQHSDLFTSVRELDVDGTSKSWSTSAWIDFFGGFELLDSVQLIGSGLATLTFPRALTRSLQTEEEPETSFLFPALQTIAFYETNFWTPTPRRNHRPLWSALSEDLDQCDRVPPDNLVIERCTVSEDHFHAFDIVMPHMDRDAGHKVRWDGLHDIPRGLPLIDNIMNARWDEDDSDDETDDEFEYAVPGIL